MSNQLGLYINLIASYHNHCLSHSVLQEAPKDKGDGKHSHCTPLTVIASVVAQS